MANVDKIYANNVELPSPTAISINDEIIWSADTGRVYSGDMFGTVIAEKRTISVKWEFLSAAEVLTIKNNCCSGFFTFRFYDDQSWQTISAYRGTLTKERLGSIGDGTVYYRTVSLDIIEQ